MLKLVLNSESAKPSRMVKTKFKYEQKKYWKLVNCSNLFSKIICIYRRTKINKTKGADQSDIDPLTLIHVMSK